MAATVSSPWATKPGAWALDAEQHEEELQQQREIDTAAAKTAAAAAATAPAADFPSLSTAVASKGKKKKGQTLSLAEFSTYNAPSQPQSVKLTPDEMVHLPTGPRERTQEELDNGGRGFRGFASSREGRWGADRDEDKGRRGRDSSREPMGPSRADEADDWGAGKRANAAAPGFERRERSTGSFFNESKADESDNWASKKSFVPAPAGDGGPGRRSGFGFESSEGRSRRSYEPFTPNGAVGADGETWGRKERVVNASSNVNENGNSGTAVGRPRLNLKPRTLPVTFERPQSPDVKEVKEVLAPVEIVPRPKGANPFGNARPREEVLAEKGQDWKEIDDKLESMKIKEIEAVAAAEKGDGPAKKGFGTGGWRGPAVVGGEEKKTERSWRKPAEQDAPAPVAAATEDDARPERSV